MDCDDQYGLWKQDFFRDGDSYHSERVSILVWKEARNLGILHTQDTL